MDKNDSIKGYDGPTSGDWFVIDIDEPFLISMKIAGELLTVLTKQGIKGMISCFTGGKGLHIYIPSAYWKLKGFDGEFHTANRLFRQKLADKMGIDPLIFDYQIYTRVLIFRDIWSLHPKTGRMKRPMIFKGIKGTNVLDWFEPVEITKANIIAYRNLIYKPDHSAIKPIATLSSTDISVRTLHTGNINNKNVNKDLKHGYFNRVCMFRIINEGGDPKGGRNNTAMLLLSFWSKELNHNEKACYHLLEEWNDRLDKPMAKYELENLMHKFNTYKMRICGHPITDKYCPNNNTCYHYKFKNMGDGAETDNMAAINEAEEAEDKRESWMAFDIIAPGLNVTHLYLNPYESTIMQLCAGSGVGKTSLAMQFALHYKQDLVFFSYELKKAKMMKFFAKALGLDIKIQSDKEKLNKATKHIHIIDRGLTPLQDYPNKIQGVEMRTGNKIGLIIIDYIQIMPVKDDNGRFVMDTQAAGRVAQFLPDVVKRAGVACLFLAQPTQAVEGRGNTRLSDTAARNGQAYQAVCDIIVTAWRPNYKIMGKTDDVTSLWNPKNRDEQSGQEVNYNWLGKRRSINGIYPGTVVQRGPLDKK
jgi:hypothetical protein